MLLLLVAAACSALREPVPEAAVELHPVPASMALPPRPAPTPALPELASRPPAAALAAVEREAELQRRQALETGLASWYGPGFEGRLTANGEVYDSSGMTAAHKELPLGTEVIVVNLENGREARLRINDRGPFVGERVIDVSKAAAKLLGFYYTGLAEVRIDLVHPDASAEDASARSVDGGATAAAGPG